MTTATMVRSASDKHSRTFTFHGPSVDEVAGKVGAFLTQKGFRLESGTERQGVYGTGSAAGHAAFGALSGRMKLNLSVTQQGDDVVVVVARGMGGWWGGLIGASRARSAFERLASELPGTVMGTLA